MFTITSLSARTDSDAVPARATRRRGGIAALIPATLVAVLAALAMPALSQAASENPEPPEVGVTITAPVDGFHARYGGWFPELGEAAPFHFEASAVSSPTSCGCTYKWTSGNIVMGSGKSLDYSFSTPGAKTVTVTATYQVAGKYAHDTASITVYADNVKPSAVIDSPAPSSTLSKNVTHALTGHATDANVGGLQPWLACSSITWQVRNSVTLAYLPAPAAGCNSQYSFPAGSYTIYMKATDPYGMSDTKSIPVTAK